MGIALNLFTEELLKIERHIAEILGLLSLEPDNEAFDREFKELIKQKRELKVNQYPSHRPIYTEL